MDEISEDLNVHALIFGQLCFSSLRRIDNCFYNPEDFINDFNIIHHEINQKAEQTRSYFLKVERNLIRKIQKTISIAKEYDLMTNKIFLRCFMENTKLKLFLSSPSIQKKLSASRTTVKQKIMPFFTLTLDQTTRDSYFTRDVIE